MPTDSEESARTMGSLGGWEIVIVVVIVLILFGGTLLPKLGRTFGRRLKGLKEGIKEGEESFKAAIKDDKVNGNKVNEKVDDTDKS